MARDLAIKVRQDLLLFTFQVQLLGHFLLSPWNIHRLELEDLMLQFRNLALSCLALLNIYLVSRARDMAHEVEARIAFSPIVQAQVVDFEVYGGIAVVLHRAIVV